ncbi:unnamed protein product [Amoebophrya sp. A25]|nr:unnamed protein product [Amoebophrya sp. A25]|eukprot:GSA25T00006286001.1
MWVHPFRPNPDAYQVLTSGAGDEDDGRQHQWNAPSSATFYGLA